MWFCQLLCRTTLMLLHLCLHRILPLTRCMQTHRTKQLCLFCTWLPHSRSYSKRGMTAVDSYTDMLPYKGPYMPT
jgi:hypothetical protein